MELTHLLRPQCSLSHSPGLPYPFYLGGSQDAQTRVPLYLPFSIRLHMYIACSRIYLLLLKVGMYMAPSLLSTLPIFTSIMPALADKLRLIPSPPSSSSRMSTLGYSGTSRCCMLHYLPHHMSCWARQNWSRGPPCRIVRNEYLLHLINVSAKKHGNRHTASTYA